MVLPAFAPKSFKRVGERVQGARTPLGHQIPDATRGRALESFASVKCRALGDHGAGEREKAIARVGNGVRKFGRHFAVILIAYHGGTRHLDNLERAFRIQVFEIQVAVQPLATAPVVLSSRRDPHLIVIALARRVPAKPKAADFAHDAFLLAFGVGFGFGFRYGGGRGDFNYAVPTRRAVEHAGFTRYFLGTLK